MTTPENEQRGRDRLAALIVGIVCVAELGACVGIFFGLRYLGIF